MSDRPGADAPGLASSVGHVAMVTNGAYAPWCAVTIRSLVESGTERPLAVQVWHDGSVTAAHEAALASMGEDRVTIEVRALDSIETDRLPDIGRFGTSVWIRCLLPRLRPDLDRVLYIDADTLVTGPLDDVFDTALDGRPIGAIVDTMPPNHWERVRAFGFVDPADYFNSGVLLMDLAAMRDDDLMAWTGAVANAFADQVHYPDQDVLNVIYAGRWHRLDPTLNAQNRLFMRPALGDALLGVEERRRITTSPTIVHFEGPGVWKPWHRLSTHPLRQRYREVLGRTPFADVGLDGGWSARLIARLPSTRWWAAQGITDRARRHPLRELRRLVVRTPPPGAIGATPQPTDLRPSRDPTHPLHGIDPSVRGIVDRAAPFCDGHATEVVEVIGAVRDRISSPAPETADTGDRWQIEAGRRGGRALATALTLLDAGPTPELEVVVDAEQPGAFGAEDVRRMVAATGYPADAVTVVD